MQAVRLVAECLFVSRLSARARRGAKIALQTSAHDSCRAAFIELVGRGKTGLGLEEDVERLVAFGGAAELAGGGPVSLLSMAYSAPTLFTASICTWLFLQSRNQIDAEAICLAISHS